MHRSMIATALAIATVSSTPALSLATEDEGDDVTVNAFARRRNSVIAEGVLRSAYQCKAETATTEDERMRALAEWVLHQYLAEIEGD